jgi:hypothetical protein
MDRGRILSEEERTEILEWIYDNSYRFMKVNEYRGHQLITEKDTPGLPSSVWSIKRRIIEKEGLADYEQEPKFQDFIAVINPGGYLYKHVDENYGDLIHSRFNVLLQLPTKGGETFYNGKVADTKEGHYIFSKSGLEEHYTNPVEEGKRISISFGFLIPVECVRKM